MPAKKSLPSPPEGSPPNQVPTDRGLQWGDLSEWTAGEVEGKLHEIGQVATNLPGIRAKVVAGNPNTEKGVHKKEQAIARLDRVKPYVQDVDMTLDSMMAGRIKHFMGGVVQNAADKERGIDTGDPHWYLGHGSDIANIVKEHGRGAFPLETAVNASVVMSQGNEPPSEKKALEHLLDSEASRALGDEGPGVALQQSRSRQAAASHSGTERNLNNATGVLRGERGIDLFTSPKFEAYRSGIQDAAAATEGQKGEYRQRVGHVSDVLLGKQIAGQEYLDLTGYKDSKAGILDPHHNTAEDSWMSAISMGQDIEGTVGGHTNVAKAMADTDNILKQGKGNMFPEHPDVSFRTLYHAANNEATIRASDMIGQATGLVNEAGESMMPSMAVQEGPWMQVRRIGNKDSDYNAEVRRVEGIEKAEASRQTQVDRRLGGKPWTETRTEHRGAQGQQLKRPKQVTETFQQLGLGL